MAELIRTTFRLRRGNSDAWKRNNPILQQGEPGYELDTGKLKIGDGTTTWNNLKYFGPDTANIYTKEEVDDLIAGIESGESSWGIF